MSTPWMKFYPTDWRADPALRMCSISARGLWMEMLCLMHEATPRGSLRVNGRGVTDRQLASLSGSTSDEVAAALAELEDAGVFSRDDEGVPFSRRMQRDDEKAARDKANGGKGGNPKIIGDNAGVNPQVKDEDKAQKPEARDQIPEEKKETRDALFEFEGWYRDYPHKVGKAAAAKAFAAARRKADLQTLIDGRDRYVKTKPPDRPWCNPATWLNQERWKDEPSTDNHHRRSASGHHAGQPRGFDAVLSGMARVAHQRGLSERERDERLDEAAGDSEFIDADWRATGSH